MYKNSDRVCEKIECVRVHICDKEEKWRKEKKRKNVRSNTLPRNMSIRACCGRWRKEVSYKRLQILYA